MEIKIIELHCNLVGPTDVSHKAIYILTKKSIPWTRSTLNLMQTVQVTSWIPVLRYGDYQKKNGMKILK